MNNTEIGQALQEAIGAHGVWKMRLRRAVESRSTEVPVETARRDDCCALGKLLYERLPAPLRNDPHYGTIRDLHRQFHAAAADALGFALDGKAAEANAVIDGRFASASTSLSSAVTGWRRHLGH